MSSRATTAHAHADPNSAGSDAVLLRLVGMVQSLSEELRDVRLAQDRAAEQMGQVQHAQTTMEGELADIKNSQSQVQQAQEDMKKLLLEAKKTMEGEHATTLNEELAWTVCRNGNAVSVAEVNALLDRGADLYRYQLPRPFRAATAAPCRRPALHALIALGHLEAVEAVMAHPRVVDLTSVDELGCSPLHVLASACPGEDAKVADMLAAMLARDRDPSMKTVVDWAQEGACRDGQRLDFLSAAAAAGRLSLLLPELLGARVPHYNCRPNFTLELKVVPQAADWARLSDEHKRALAYYKVWEQQQQATADLVALLESCEWKPQSSAATLQRLRELARLGADVMHLVPSPPGWSVPASILTYFIRSGPMEVVECLLRTPHTLDFTVGNKYGSTPLHFVPYPWTGSTEKVSEEVRRLLHLLLDRIEQHPHEDVVDWGRKDNDGHAPISWAAAYGHLAPFVKVVFHERPVPYFTDHPGRITITSRGKSSDVKRLPEADRKRLHFTRDIDEKA